jgi:hypothetical protein
MAVVVEVRRVAVSGGRMQRVRAEVLLLSVAARTTTAVAVARSVVRSMVE